jgi:2-iminobutanoate/2-iminopropanoate deaminase
MIPFVSHHRRIVATDAAPAAVGPYSQGVASGGFVFCSGQIAPDAGSIGEQTTRCLENLDAVCRAAGTSLREAVRIGVFLTDIERDWGKVNAAYAAYFEGMDPPARAAVGVAALPKGAQVEIEAVVALPD